jgi:hypothetical protein
MKKYIAMLAVVAIGTVAFVGAGCCCPCKKKCKAPDAAAAQAVCGKCGEVAGSAKCCQPGAEKCAKCGLDKGSPGCKAKCGG